ncbi:MAG: formate dehydrogenase [Deltaproteobacteria bacterium]|nr:formate dehydrogenase [Deltaproteobacteria bacterium]
MAKSIFIDTTRCTACRGCQVACKQWHDHEAVPTKQTGTHQNPPDLTPENYKLVRFAEHKIDNNIFWLFFPDQCRHCVQPACKMMADEYVEGAIVQDEGTGAVICTEKTKELTKEQCEAVIDACPYNIPRRDDLSGLLRKCDMCIDRVNAGLEPMCVKSCCTGAMNFGDREEMLMLAKMRLTQAEAEKTTKSELERKIACDVHKSCTVLDEEDLNVIYFLDQPRELYHLFAGRETRPINRADFLAGMVRPLRNMLG